MTTPTSSTPTPSPVRLPYRKVVLLALLERFGGKLSSRDFQKLLMLYTREYGALGSYDFVPYRFGGFSFQSYADRRGLIASSLLADGDAWQLQGPMCWSSQLTSDDRRGLDQLHTSFSTVRGRNLVRELYRRYPYYAIKSEIAHQIMTEAELAAIEKARPKAVAPCLFTIGYEGLSLDAYLDRLVGNNIKLLCDVRRNPLSRKYGFSKSTLSYTVESLGIHYHHIPELGISSDDRRSLNSLADYKRLFDHYDKTTIVAQRDKLKVVVQLSRTYGRVALTCFEADVCMCHRGRIVDAIGRLPSPPAFRHI
jgi:hypothetical protein